MAEPKLTDSERAARRARPAGRMRGPMANRERQVAEFLLSRLHGVSGIARIYSERAGGALEFTVEVEDVWGAAREAVTRAFYDLYGSGIGEGVGTHLFPVSEAAPGPEQTVWLGA